MTAIRLPVPDGDDGAWGGILNDFLRVEHNGDGTLKKSGLITGAEQAIHKGVANGYAELDGNGLVPDSELAVPLSTVGDYIGLNMYTQSIPNGGDYFSAVWDQVTASRGSSLTWSDDQPDTVAITAAGVYAVSVTINWDDFDDTTSSSRAVQLFMECGFQTQDTRPSVVDGVNTHQSVAFIGYLQPGDDISVSLQQFSSITSIGVDVLMLVTRLG